MSEVAKHIRVRGRVQGVFFRAWTVQQAEALGVSGWVRNRRDGSVEIVAAGAEPAVHSLIERVRQGPPVAEVESLEVDDSPEEVPAGFSKRPTF